MIAKQEAITTNGHPVLEELQRRINGDQPEMKLALSIEGGGMRSVVSAGMISALEQAGIRPNHFDAVFGSSGGAFNATYFVAERAYSGTPCYWQNTGKDLIDFRRLVRSNKPAIYMNHMIDLMSGEVPLDFDKVLATRKLRPLATDIRTGEAVAFEPAESAEELKQQLRASSAVPVLGHGVVNVNGSNYLDAGFAEKVPLETPFQLGFDAVLVLATQSATGRHIGISDQIADRLLSYSVRRSSAHLARLALKQSVLDLEKAIALSEMTQRPTGPPYAYVISPAPGQAPVGNTEQRQELVIAGANAGYAAVQNALGLGGNQIEFS